MPIYRTYCSFALRQAPWPLTACRSGCGSSSKLSPRSGAPFAAGPSSGAPHLRLELSRGSSRPYGSASASPAPRNPRGRLAIGGAFGVLALAGVAAWASQRGNAGLSPDRFTSVTVRSITPLTKDTSLFKLALPPSLLPPSTSPANPVLSIYVMQPDLQIQRPYTPLRASSFDRDGTGEIELVIKRYDDGEVSRWMHRLVPGEEVRIRGPVVTWDSRTDGVDELVFIVGGTGITPAYQYIESALKASPSSTPTISLIYSSPSPSEILLKPSLDQLASKHPSRFSIRYLVDRPDKGAKSSSELVTGRVQKKTLEKWIGPGRQEKRMLVVVCGPDGMIATVAGPRARDLSQGPVAGILGELGYTDSQVLKL